MQMENTQIIVEYDNKPPIFANRMDWRDHPELVPRRNMPPVKLAPIAEPDVPDFLAGEELEADGETNEAPFQPVDAETLSACSTTTRQGTVYTCAKKKPGKPSR